jgi:hypothetical protein
MDIWALAYHEGEDRKRIFEGAFEITLRDEAVSDDETVNASIAIVARASSHAPKSWHCGHESPH